MNHVIYISYKLKLYVYKVRVFIENLLEVIYIHYIYLKLRVALYKVVCLLGANKLYIMYYKEGIYYIFYNVVVHQLDRVTIRTTFHTQCNLLT